MARSLRSKVIAGTGNLTSSKSVIDLTVNTTLEPSSKAFPDYTKLVKLEVEITTIAASAASVIWNLAKDAAGEFGLTPEVTSTIVLGKTTTTKGSFNALLDVDNVLTANGVTGHVYLVARTDTGTCTVSKALLLWVP